MPQPFISICIPAYRRVDYLKRLLDSVAAQDYTSFEIIVTDDSPDESVKACCDGYAGRLPVVYFRNALALGTPENWNEGIRKAKGSWIKLMHDDDFFLYPGALGAFAREAQNTDGDFIFSAYRNVTAAGEVGAPVKLVPFRKRALVTEPLTLLSSNVIGPPSVTLVRNTRQFWYDNRMKWLVDMDYYIQVLKGRSFRYIQTPLVGIGVHENQVTKVSSLNPEVEIPEHLLILEKYGTHGFSKILFYDAFWRLFRNLGFRTLADIQQYAKGKPVPDTIQQMIRFQSKFPLSVLRIGICSKILMLMGFLFRNSNID